jgi:hypothetical protein
MGKYACFMSMNQRARNMCDLAASRFEHGAKSSQVERGKHNRAAAKRISRTSVQQVARQIRPRSSVQIKQNTVMQKRARRLAAKHPTM